MKILKASAGSGKTYSLTKEYIRLLLTSDAHDAYRHILAVTFTNKATDEMKRRIIGELYTLAYTPEKSPYKDELIGVAAYDLAELKSKAYWMLTNILHDYSAFAVSTIDRFFQQTLRAFSREVGQFASYQVELDKDILVDDAVNRVMGKIGDKGNPALLDWVVKGVKADLRATGRFTMERRMREMARSIVSENPKDTQYDWTQLDALKQRCDVVISAYVNKVREGAGNILDAMRSAGVSPEDTNRGFAKAVYQFVELDEREFVNQPTPSFKAKALYPDTWFAKTKAALLAQCKGILEGPMAAFVEMFDKPYQEYSTAFSIRSQIYSLGMAGELRKAFVEAQRDRGVISIDDTNTILHGIIDGTDTPFVYEKLGVRFEDFLLDEFQDTSRVQWDNFRPLLENSEASGNENLIVGDVKQSIYRWRGSDWNLLGNGVQKQMRTRPEDVSVLVGNYRTCRAIVEFNNAFFPYAADLVDRQLEINPTGEGSVSSIYGDVAQKVCTREKANGSVDVVFVSGDDKQMEEILSGIQSVRELGGQYGDIAILVRGNAEGAEIAEALIAKDIPVVSDDSLYVKSSVTVRRLLSQLSLIENPKRGEEGNVAGFLASEMNLPLPEQYHSLTDLAETILASLKNVTPDLFVSETPFIQAFMDWVQDWSGKNGNNLGAMLRDWSDADPKISSPESFDAVRVMTIHKAKGLEFPYVIFPFAEKVSLYRTSMYWCKPDVAGTALEDVAVGKYRTSLSEGSVNSCFRGDYINERYQQAVDNMNVFYVAMTRAKFGIKVIAAMPPKSICGALEKSGEVGSFKNISQILYAYVGGSTYHSGTAYDYGTIDRTVKGAKPLVLKYECSSEAQKRRLVFRVRKQADEAVEMPINEQEPTLF